MTDHKDKHRMIYLRYGSLSDFSQEQMSKCQVARLLRMPPMTVIRNLNQFVRAEFNFTAAFDNRRSTRFNFMSERLKTALVDKRMLQLWAPYSINQRVEIVRNVFQESIGRSTLQRFYAANKITY